MSGLRIRQLGYVTDDVEASAMEWVRSVGAGPFFVMKGMGFRDWSYFGAPQEMTLDIAFGQVGDIMVELIRPNGPWPNVYGEAMPSSGCRAHHHGYLVGDLDAAAAELGGSPVTQAHLSAETELRYFDRCKSLGLFVELISDSLESREFFELSAKAAREWDGESDPVRPFKPDVA
ncbi:MAG: VOC family protein [Sphingomonadaceae bacterium]